MLGKLASGWLDILTGTSAIVGGGRSMGANPLKGAGPVQLIKNKTSFNILDPENFSM